MITTSTGAKAQALTYSPFGGLRTNQSFTTPAIDVPYKYTGKEFDYSTDFHYHESRYQDPWFGRFISPDTIVPDPLNPQDLNRYSYVRNSPPNYIDPTGSCSITASQRDPNSCWNWDSWRSWFRDTFGRTPQTPQNQPNTQIPGRNPAPIPDGPEETVIWGYENIVTGSPDDSPWPQVDLILPPIEVTAPRPSLDWDRTWQASFDILTLFGPGAGLKVEKLSRAIGLGKYAGESIAARSSARDFTAAERALINAIGAKTGCHTVVPRIQEPSQATLYRITNQPMH